MAFSTARVAATTCCLLVSLGTSFPSDLPQSTEAVPSHPHFESLPKTVLMDEVIPIVLSGLPAGAKVTIHLHGGGTAAAWSSKAAFTADPSGVVDLTRMSPTGGSYSGVDPMGLFWSAQWDHSVARPAPAPPPAVASNPPPQPWQLDAEIGNAVVATATVLRRAVAEDVKVTMVQDHGLVGAFYQPPGEGRHPAALVVTGSGGGLPPATTVPGGLASRGYAVLALAYFGVEDLPQSLHDIPLEYFGTALEWLAAQPSVDPARIGVVGTSRGGELALLLGVIYPQIRSVVAYVPSNVVWGGCCNGRSESSWTIGGRPVAWRNPRSNDFIATQRATIQVERIHGAVLLISGRQDQVWHSTEMSDEVMSRLRKNNFAYPFKHLAYDNAGHGIGRPYTSVMDVNNARHPLTGRSMAFGGTPEGTEHAREDSWRQMLAFMEENLRGRLP
jgi:dienelactone hydrolase